MSSMGRGAEVLERLDIRRIVSDLDLDGVISAAILKTVWPQAEVLFSDPTRMGAGMADGIIDRQTAICDLPLHHACGLYIDHHLTNQLTAPEIAEFEAAGGFYCWNVADSAARIAYELFKADADLTDIAPLMELTDALDGGRIGREMYLSDEPLIWLSRTISTEGEEYALQLVRLLAGGVELATIMRRKGVQAAVARQVQRVEEILEILPHRLTVIDRLAILRLEGTGLHMNGYLVTAHVGDDCDSCCIISGYPEGVAGEKKWPLMGSFYNNSFLHQDGGVMNLTQLACLYDARGGGHANACGCRVQPLDSEGNLESRPIELEDIERNLEGWMAEWNSSREQVE